MGIREDINVQRFRSPYYEAMINIMFTGHWLTAAMDRTLRPLGLSEPQYNVLTLAYAARGEAVSATEIKRGMVQRESNVTRIVDRLVDRGWLTRVTCPENRRKVDIRITGDGRKAYRRARKVVLEVHAEMETRLSSDDLKQLSEYLDTLRHE